MEMTQETDFGYFVGINGKEQLSDIRNGRFIRLAHWKDSYPEKEVEFLKSFFACVGY